jgi:NTP pyrophosphatase (non-canonical NTP hydrolase)
MSLTFRDLIKANLSRTGRWAPLIDWSPLEWAGAMAGEAGEACNAAKKLLRVNHQLQSHDNRLLGQSMTLEDQKEHYRKQIGLECADTVLYALLLCDRVDVDLESCIREVFNKKSEEYGFPERL